MVSGVPAPLHPCIYYGWTSQFTVHIQTTLKLCDTQWQRGLQPGRLWYIAIFVLKRDVKLQLQPGTFTSPQTLQTMLGSIAIVNRPIGLTMMVTHGTSRRLVTKTSSQVESWSRFGAKSSRERTPNWLSGLPQSQCVRWGLSSLTKRGTPQLSAPVSCGQSAGWIKVLLGMEVGSAQATLC